MCGRFVSASDADGLVRFFVIDERKTDDLPPNYNVAPTDPVYAVAGHNQRRYLVSFRWGLVPHWAESASVGARMINARAETAAEKPAYRDALRRRRCLIPADGFYEWRKDATGAKRPHFIHRPDDAPIAFAGLWETWRDTTDPEASPLKTCTILTRPAVEQLQVLHDRMPVTLDEDAWDAWLDADAPLPAIHDLLRVTPPELTFRPVSDQVNSVRNNGPQLLAAVG